MVNFSAPLHSWPGKNSVPLSFEERYPCPVCRYGQIEGLFLVDAFSCRFCRHIFTVEDGPQQSLCLEDHAQPMKWRWSGDRWLVLRHPVSRDGLLFAWILGVLFVSIPTVLVWLVHHTFPPLPGQRGFMFPLVGLTFLAHFTIAGWLCLEYYQWSFYVALKFYSRWMLNQVLPDS
jgi:hypothetical protein